MAKDRVSLYIKELGHKESNGNHWAHQAWNTRESH